MKDFSCRSEDLPQISAAATTSSSAGAPPAIVSSIPHLGRGIAVGQYGTMARSFTTEEVDRFARLIHDFNPLHRSGDYKDDTEEEVELRELDPQTTAALEAAGLIRCDDDYDDDDDDCDGNGRKGSSRKAVVHGVLVSSLFSSIFAHLAPGCVYRSQTLDYVSPVWAGDALVGSVRVASVRDLGRSSRGGVLVRCDTKVFTLGNNNNNNNDAGPVPHPVPARLAVTGRATVWLPIGWTARRNKVEIVTS